MAEASIPVDLFNPGQVFACLGLLEAAEVLLGEAEGGFDWSNEVDTRFCLHAKGDQNPIAVVLQFLADAEMRRLAPHGYVDPPKKNKKKSGDDSEDAVIPAVPLDFSDTFPCATADPMSLPIRLLGSLNGAQVSIHLGHWADGSSRNDFKLYSGNRSAADIGRAMLWGTCKKTKKRQSEGDVKTLGVRLLLKEYGPKLVEKPFDMLTPMGGSFNFDPRGAWTGIDAGYSPNDQKHSVAASPVVEILAALGLEHARPDEFERGRVRYAAWGCLLPPSLARAAVGGSRLAIPLRLFTFVLDYSGKNKVVTFAQESIQ